MNYNTIHVTLMSLVRSNFQTVISKVLKHNHYIGCFGAMKISFFYVKVFMFSVGLVLTLWQGFNCTDKYLQFNRSTRVKMIHSKDTLKPALIICPDYNYAYNKTLLKQIGISSVEKYKQGKWKGNSTEDPKKIFKERVILM